MFDRVPDNLRAYRQWVCHQFPDKMPRCPIPNDAGELPPAKCSDPLTWGTFEQAVKQVRHGRAKGIGIEFANGIVGIDIDDCADGGEISAFAQTIIDRLKSYTEFSPSGTGIHILCEGKLPGSGRKHTELGLEMYDTGRYFTVTGNAYLDPEGYCYPYRACADELAKIYHQYFDEMPPEQTKLGRAPASAPAPAYDQPVRDLSDQEILAIAFKSKGGDAIRRLYDGTFTTSEVPTRSDGSVDDSGVDFALVNHLAFWFNKDPDRIDRVFRTSAVFRKKWDQKRGGRTYGQRTIDRACAGTRETFVPFDRKPMGRYDPPPIPDPPPPPPAPPPPPPGASSPPETFPINEEIEIDPNPTKYTYDDTGNAHRFRDAYYKELRYNHVDKIWHCWTGKQWAEDQTGEIKRRADQLLGKMEEEAKEKPEEFSGPMLKLVKRTRSSRAKEAMIKEAQHLAGIPVLPNEFDRYQDALNIQNGVLDLHSGKLRPHKRNLMLSMMANVTFDATAKCPRWLKFLGEVTQDNIELQIYLQRMVGYCLTGETSEQCVFFLYGNGKNGKSTFLDTVSSLMGDYAKNSQAETVMQRDRGGQGARSDIARLKGARLVTTSEPDYGCRLDEATVKQMTGGEKITARMLYRSEIEYKPEFKIMMGTNVKPIIKGTDDGVWRRVRLIPFTAHIPAEKVDRRLGEKLHSERAGILNWALEGAKLWYEKGLPPCAIIDTAGKDYRLEMDRMRQFVEECIVRSPGHTLQASALFGVYKSWCEQNGERYPFSMTKFGTELQERHGLRKQKTSRFNEYLDVDFSDIGNQMALLGSTSGRDSYRK